MKQICFFLAGTFCMISQLMAQNPTKNSEINLMLLRGDYEKVIDTCRQILTYDSLNPDIHYKMGLAFQNTLEEDLALKNFSRAVDLAPGNKVYNFALAKEYYDSGKNKLAEPLLMKLCSIDSMKWAYAYYLSNVYMQSNRFEEAINTFRRFVMKDSTNCAYLDKLAFAYLKNGDFAYATDLYNKSLSINQKNLTAIKNLSYLYAATMNSDTAIQLLSKGIEIDSSDMNLYIMRAQLYYSKSYTKRALDDYLVILASGDSSKIYLKRTGIGYSYNFQPQKAIVYLLKAYKADSSDYETCSYLAQCYYKTKDIKKSIYYYDKTIRLLTPVEKQLGLTYSLLGDSYYSNERYQDAISNYLKGQNKWSDPENYMKIANIYDGKLHKGEKAISYYQKFLDNLKDARRTYPSEYTESIQKRLDYLKKNPPQK
jgi:type IV pilus assembly protein PilF